LKLSWKNLKLHLNTYLEIIGITMKYGVWPKDLNNKRKYVLMKMTFSQKYKMPRYTRTCLQLYQSMKLLFFFLQCLHFFLTQIIKALNQSQIYLTPQDESILFSTRSFLYRNIIMVRTHKCGYSKFWKAVFDDLQIDYSEMFCIT